MSKQHHKHNHNPHITKRQRKLFAKAMIRRPTKAEKALRDELLNRKGILPWLKFENQAMLLSYIIDFYFPAVKLAVEVDGKNHNTKHAKAYGKRRTRMLKKKDITVIRFTNEQVTKDAPTVVSEICDKVSHMPIISRRHGKEYDPWGNYRKEFEKQQNLECYARASCGRI